MSISVLTIVRGRQTYLENQLQGLLLSVHRPDQWIVVGMDQEVQLPVSPHLDVRTGRVDGDGKRLPLAAARNHAASLCTSERMIFLDVDCISAPTMIGSFVEAIDDEPRLWMGQPLYLPEGTTTKPWRIEDLQAAAVNHPLLPKLPDGKRHESDRYKAFWSLCFGLHRSTFDAIGGFDESYHGYGGEDTDFAFEARRRGVGFGFVGAIAFHQYHLVCKPPLNHFEDILDNASQFHRKWGLWPMRSWLDAFAQRDLIRFSEEDSELTVLRSPTADEIEMAVSKTSAGF